MLHVYFVEFTYFVFGNILVFKFILVFSGIVNVFCFASSLDPSLPSSLHRHHSDFSDFSFLLLYIFLLF